jgi:hypothetical protein
MLECFNQWFCGRLKSIANNMCRANSLKINDSGQAPIIKSTSLFHQFIENIPPMVEWPPVAPDIPLFFAASFTTNAQNYAELS